MMYKKFFAACLLAGLLGAASPTAASSWYWIDSDASLSTYADTDTLKVNGDYSKIWVKTVYSDGHFDMVQYLFHEPSQRFAIVNAASYDKDGNQLSVYTPAMKDFQWKPIVPDSLAAKIYAIA